MKMFVQFGLHITLVCLTCIQLSHGQSIGLRFEQFGLKEGLPNLSIQTLYQDQAGYLWIGTWDGLSRYDGYHFENFHHRPFDTTSLPANDVKAILEDKQGRLFVGMHGGLCRWNEETRSFVRYPENPEKAGSLISKNIGALAIGKNGNLFVGKSLGSGWLSELDVEQDSFMNHRTNRFRVLLSIKEGILGAPLGGGLIYWSEQGDSIQAPNTILLGLELPHVKVYSLIEDRQGDIWIGAGDGLYQYQRKERKMKHYTQKKGLIHPVVTALCEDQKGHLWIGTPKGLHRLSSDRQEMSLYQQQLTSPYSLSHDHITSILEDRAGNLWVGTARGGLNKARLARLTHFHRYDFTHFGIDIHKLIVFAFAEGKENRLWVGTSQGLFLVNKDSKSILQHIQYGKTEVLGLASDVVMSVYETPDEQVLIGLGGNAGLNILEIRTQQMRHIPVGTEAHQLVGGPIRDIRPISGQADRYWLTGGRLHALDLTTAHIQAWTSLCDEEDNCLSTYLYDSYWIDSCQVWIVGNGGLTQLNTCDTILQHYSLGTQQSLMAVQPDKDEHLWLGSYGGGLFRFNPFTKETINYELSDGLPNNFVYGILPDATGNLWMSTNHGLARFSPHTEQFVQFGIDDGLPHHEFATGASMLASDGEMFFGGQDGFVSFYPSQIQATSSRFQAPIHITDVRVSGESVHLDTLNGKPAKIAFPAYRGQHLEIEFVSLDFTRPEKNQYRYQLKGWDSDWSPPKERNSVQYNSLEPGTYTFLVQGSNSEGIFSDQAAAIQIYVQPLWHHSLWIRYLLPGLLLCLIGYLGYRRIQYLRRRERGRLQHRIAKVRQEALASQMDHHFTFNSLNSIQRFIAENDTESALYFISRFGKLMRRMLNQARENYVTIEEEIDTLDLYLSLEALRTRQKFSYEFKIDPDLDIYNIEMPANLLQPYIENAIWHGLMPKEDHGHIVLRFSLRGQDILCMLEDDGIGRKKSKALQSESKFAHKSKGMRITEERLETLKLLHGDETSIVITDLEDEAGIGIGTRVEVRMPNRM